VAPERAAQSHSESHGLHILLASLIDYAGLFPPAGLEMRHAVSNYARYREGEHAWALGRFIVPAARLEEFESVLPTARSGAGWHISALLGPDVAADMAAISQFNSRHTGRAQIDSVETKAATPEEIGAMRRSIPDSVLAYFEIPHTEDPATLLAAIHKARARAKIRTGGLTTEVFPAAEQIARFILRCIAAEVPFKATAGLHHPLRCVRPLTYAPDAPTGTMHGFINVFMAAAFALGGMPEPTLVELLEEESPSAFRFDATGASWRDHRVDQRVLLECRGSLGMSFGSCSFDEPIDDLHAIDLL
jgi:hypothetical protein